MTWILAGLVIGTAGSLILGWSMIQPRIWLTGQMRYDAKISALLLASQKGDDHFAGDDKAATEFTNSFQHVVLEDLRRRATQRLGIVGAGLLVLGFILQVVGTVATMKA